MKGKTDFAFGSTAPGTWNLSLEGREPWMLLTLASSADQAVVRAISSNDIELVKQTLISPGEGLFVRSFQVVFASDFPDNLGVGVAEVYELIEGKTKKKEVFYRLKTKYGVFRFGGPAHLLSNHENLDWSVRIYSSERPPKRYYAD
ncbi:MULTISPECIES: hypothetical protein [Pseudomonas]|nr:MULTISPECIES: hypothetical protein [Pseudomonas]EIU7180176.1 hypothetical protein [Pseudomonas aeruginosa]EJB8391713.1 hypothetical protein [Pseudomonas aeruginosa]EKJ8516311.1 hypothetical protein [Pseudomonas aeruginosa]EKV6262322.1 hypothetical protein [Pseudomonas aeruginosa]EKZ9522659.1 hypothetical protein [Pseudomonas aeruginosa]